MRTITRAILAGAMIGTGGMAFLTVRGGALGAFLFSIGLLSVFIGGFDLFTGKVSKIDISGIPRLLLILVGNFVGATITGIIFRAIASPDTINFAMDICDRKLLEGWKVILLGALCNVLIYMACETKDTIRIILCVMVFILAGFEHSIANMFYFGVVSNVMPGWEVLRYLGMNVLGNAIGGILIFRLSKLGKETNE